MSVLDDPARLDAGDPSGMLAVVESAADQWHDGVARARSVDLSPLPDHEHIASVVVCGMGGSGIAGDVAQVMCASRSIVPVTVVKGYALPAFADARTLVCVASYSGNTEETLACLEQALKRKAPVLAIATGGRLAELARANSFPCIIPAGGLQPRAAFPYLAGGLLIALERLGVLPDLTAELVETDSVLREQTATCARDVSTERNPAKQLASVLAGRVPIVWGQEGALGVAAARWRTQLNENAKVPASSSAFSELDHNEVVGLGPGADARPDSVLVVLRAATEPQRIARRIDATVRLVREKVGSVVEAHARGARDLAQLASAVQLGDFASTYLAILRGIDPTPIEAIERLKADIT